MRSIVSVLLAFFFFTSLLFSQTIQWQQLSGPHGGAIYSIVNDNNGNMFASAMWGKGPYKSTDNGETWFSIKNGLTPATQYCPMNISPNGNLFVAGFNNSDNCIYRSTDGGNNWTNSLNTAGSSIYCISFDQDNNIYAGTYSGIYKSSDNGENWAPYGTFTNSAIAIVFNDSGNVFVGNSVTVYRSTDNGASWTSLPTGGGTTTLAINNDGHLFAGKSGNGGILRSINNGDSWTYVYPAYTIQIQEAATVLIDTNNDIYFPTYDGKGVIKSTDNGDTWTEMNNNLGCKYLRVASKNSSGDFFTAGDYSIYKSTDNCASWHSVGLNICSVNKIVINSDGDIFTAEWGVNRSTDGGQTWETINSGLANLDTRTFTIKEDGTIFCGAGLNYNDPGVIFRSSNNGNNWVRTDTGIPQGSHLRSMTIDADGNIYAGTSHHGVYKSTDNGSGWFTIGAVNEARGLAFNSTGDLFLASYGQGFWKLPAGDTIWVDLTSNIGSGYLWSMLIGNNDFIYADQNRSTDNGQTWTTYSVGDFISSIAENSAGHLFCGTFNSGSGIFRSTNFGDTWEQINSGLTIMDIRSVAVDSDDYLYAGSWGESVFKTTTPTITDVDDIQLEPTSFYLAQNYPNPFNPSTKISWQSPVGSWQTLKVYDVLGNEVATLVDEYKPAGSYVIEFNPASSIKNLPAGRQGLASGIYFYQLRAGEYTAVKKMLLIK